MLSLIDPVGASQIHERGILCLLLVASRKFLLVWSCKISKTVCWENKAYWNEYFEPGTRPFLLFIV